MMRNLKKVIVLTVMTAGFFLFNKTGLHAQQKIEQAIGGSDEMSSLDGSKDIKGQRVDFVAGDIETISDSTIRLHGTDYLYRGNEPCHDMMGNAIALGSLKEGDIITIDYIVTEDTIVSVRLDEKQPAANEELSRENVNGKIDNSQEIIILENGVYSN